MKNWWVLLGCAWFVCACDDAPETDANQRTVSQERQPQPDGVIGSIADENIGPSEPTQKPIRARTSRLGRQSDYSAIHRGRADFVAIKGVAQIEREERTQDQIHQSAHTRQRGRHEVPLASLPIWQREKVRVVREQRHAIYDQGVKEAAAVRGESPEKRREWTRKWRERTKDKIERLRREEAAAQRIQAASQPTQEVRNDLLGRLNETNPKLREADLPVIEYLLPPARELATKPAGEWDDDTRKLLEAHRLLAESFPQSVGGVSKQPIQ